MNAREYELMLLSSKRSTPVRQQPEPEGVADFDPVDLMAVAAGTAPPELVARVEGFVAGNPESEVARAMEVFRGYARSEPAPEPPTGGVLDRMKADGFAPGRKRPWAVGLIIALVAVAAFVVAVISLPRLFENGRSDDTRGPTTTQPVPPTLPDQTTKKPHALVSESER